MRRYAFFELVSGRDSVAVLAAGIDDHGIERWQQYSSLQMKPSHGSDKTWEAFSWNFQVLRDETSNRVSESKSIN